MKLPFASVRAIIGVAGSPVSATVAPGSTSPVASTTMPAISPVCAPAPAAVPMMQNRAIAVSAYRNKGTSRRFRPALRRTGG